MRGSMLQKYHKLAGICYTIKSNALIILVEKRILLVVEINFRVENIIYNCFSMKDQVQNTEKEDFS